MKQRTNIILALEKEEKNIYKLLRETGMSAPHLLRNLEIFKKKGLVNIEKKGREKRISLTEKGKRLAVYLKAIKEITGE